MDKVLIDIEKLKDANREMKYTNGEFTMIEAVVGLLMFVNGEIKEARLQVRWECLMGSVRLRDSIQKRYPTNAGRVLQN